MTEVRRARLRIEGLVQGVGFRPYLHRLATELGLGGFVRNDGAGVLVEIEGCADAVAWFCARLPRELPVLAIVERSLAEELPLQGSTGFTIDPSRRPLTAAAAQVAPDVATCEACLRELFDPGDRRFRYPFLNCTDCGPRLTIVRSTPYDRARTTMAGFPMCARCRTEYQDPRDRRFHAEPIACPACGPALTFSDAAGRAGERGEAAMAAAVAALRAGAIVAIKGLGGFHLACLAGEELAVARLRARKRREERPFAVMVPNLAAARTLASIDGAEGELLASPARPIVLVRRRPQALLAPGVAPGVCELGLMLAYSPIHHLLGADLGAPLVLTSGNVSDEPIVYRNEAALVDLRGVADHFLMHDRTIETRVEDSVARVVTVAAASRAAVIRRSRGYAPAALALPLASPRPLLGCGAELKNTFCLARADRAWPGPHIGDLRNYETLQGYQGAIAHFERLVGVEPEVLVHDLHPDYLSTTYAQTRAGTVAMAVQHHHAHLAACLAEHGETGVVIGAIYDGSGYGEDGTIWGGELLVGTVAACRRAGHLWPVRLPGGERAVREPWRMACAWLVAAGEVAPALPSALAPQVDARRWTAVAELCRSGLAAPITTSAGRYLDGMAALCGLRAFVSYEGQAAIELEALADPQEQACYPVPLVRAGGLLVLDARETVRALLADSVAGVPLPRIAARVHNGLRDATALACVELAGELGLDQVVLSGGVFQNRLLLEGVAAQLHGAGLAVLAPSRLPANDGGIAFGQVAVAAARLSAAG